jgi:hypothetical protein
MPALHGRSHGPSLRRSRAVVYQETQAREIAHYCWQATISQAANLVPDGVAATNEPFMPIDGCRPLTWMLITSGRQIAGESHPEFCRPILSGTGCGGHRTA